MASDTFKSYVLSGRFNKTASQAVADAIATTKAHGLPVEGCANTDTRRAPVQFMRGDTRNLKKKLSKRAA